MEIGNNVSGAELERMLYELAEHPHRLNSKGVHICTRYGQPLEETALMIALHHRVLGSSHKIGGRRLTISHCPECVSVPKSADVFV